MCLDINIWVLIFAFHMSVMGGFVFFSVFLDGDFPIYYLLPTTYHHHHYYYYDYYNPQPCDHHSLASFPFVVVYHSTFCCY